MAIIKNITADNGVPLSYHRIALLTIDVNNQCTILVHSYIDTKARQQEIDYKAGIAEVLNAPYIHPEYYTTDYDQDFSVNKAYQWLKTLPEFEGAIDG